MAQKVDLYTLLRTYALKNNTAYIGLDIFISFLKNNAERENGGNLQINDWAGNTKEKVMTELSELVNSGKCKMKVGTKGQKIFLPVFYIDKLAQVYVTIGESGEQPYPNEKSLRFEIPEDLVRRVSVETGLLDYMNNPQKTALPVIKLLFPKSFGEALALSTHIPGRILEAAIIKIKDSLRKNNQLDSIKQKLLIHFPGQMPRVKEFINILMMRPLDAVAQMEEANEFTFSAWVFLCPVIKTQIADSAIRNNEITPADAALFQAVSILLIINNHYKILAMNQKERELMLASVDEKMLEPPYRYTMSDIMQFTTKQGIPIFNNFPENEFQAFIKKRLAVPDTEHLPEWLRYGEDVEWFIRKDKVWNFLKILIADARTKVRDEVTTHWMNILRDYHRDVSMDKDQNFEDMLNRNVRLFVPSLYTILHDKKTAVLQEELLRNKSEITEIEKYYTVDKPITLSKMLNMNRTEIMTGCRYSLPLWYSIPFIVSIICFFRNGPAGKYVDANKRMSGKKDTGISMQAQAEKLMADMVPEGSDVDQYLESIIDRWNQILNKTARNTLIHDVNAIIKNHVRHVLKMQDKNRFNAQMLEATTESIISANSALGKINNRDALRLYIKLYITKILSDSNI
ncbi:hypothetical protein FACS1894190_08730 [Spirochaetia bacterium]|nr:hypothetical protein FACS1894190_08730 [Spirochaetia bacterium]